MVKTYRRIKVGSKFSLVDLEDYPLLSRIEWHLQSEGYARATIGGQTIYMHRLILPTGKGFVIDHVNFNRLDNRKSNLQVLTNNKNLTRSFKSTLKYNRTSWHKISNKWRARIKLNKKEIHLGLFKNRIDAVRAIQKYIGVKNGN